MLLLLIKCLRHLNFLKSEFFLAIFFPVPENKGTCKRYGGVDSLKKVKLKIIGNSQTGFQKKISNQKQSFKKTSFKNLLNMNI